ncbi:DUF2470 domain-containing protein [Streptomyces sp. RCU064]|uniref:DUF2470 domain-containing protein n=1 Tax=Streptomyces rugosispiralis TaxID=2967341 RepID=A0ABT1UXZ0_9ACTN|nr:DUF2470 domain-containing protein [Streptomyces rugosispiralis]MCQ8189987.1 DUF2470 domain-containing protein [Streptomyces rugosispiralis]
MTIPGTEALDDLGVDGPVARTVAPDGDVLLLMPSASPTARAATHAQDDELTCVMEITDVAPVAMPHRIRGRAWVAGWLTPVPCGERTRTAAALLAERHPMGESLGLDQAPRPPRRGEPAAGVGPAGTAAWTLLRLEVGEASVDDLWGADGVEPDDFTSADPDPLVRHEADLLQHLHAAHGEQVRGLCALLGDRSALVCTRGPATPVALDRFGLRVRFTDEADRPFDARFDFPEPVRTVSELRYAMHALFDAATG